MMPLVIATEPLIPRSGREISSLPSSVARLNPLLPTVTHTTRWIKSRASDSPLPPYIRILAIKGRSPIRCLCIVMVVAVENSEKASLGGNARGRANHTVKTEVEADLVLLLDPFLFSQACFAFLLACFYFHLRPVLFPFLS